MGYLSFGIIITLKLSAVVYKPQLGGELFHYYVVRNFEPEKSPPGVKADL